MLSRKGSALILVLIAVMVLTGRLLTDGADRTVPAEAAATSDLVAFDLGSRVDRYRVELAEARLARAEERREERREAIRRERAKFRDLPGSVSRQTLESIASCESGGDPRVVSSNGLYHGKYQFSLDTWASVGGRGSPAAAPEVEQDYRAALLYERSGPGQWPVCGS
ncbi:MAG: transglycosylase family protein [Solirubrobacterales bacterium]|nr:transglycosylase family protein [Solirubrobacterales bacterium]